MSSHKTMACGIKYKAPLKSMRTIRALKIEQEDPPEMSFEGTVGNGDADHLNNKAGIAFAWEDAPGRSEIEEQDKSASLELKPSPQQETLAQVEVTEPPLPAVAPAESTMSSTPTDDSPLTPSLHHQLPPKPSQTRVPLPSFGAVYQQSATKPPSIPRKTVLESSVSDSGHSTAVHAPQSGQNSSLSSPTLRASISQRYFAERCEGSKDFFPCEEKAAATAAEAIQHTRLAYEVSSQNEEDWDGDQTDAGDNFSHMNMRDRHGRCQVSILDGELLDSRKQGDSSTLRDFIMERFLPAAKAMATESTDAVVNRRSSQEALSGSPHLGRGRQSLPGRSRFAFKDRLAEDDVDDQEKLFSCKFPWQVSALRVVGPQNSPPLEPRSVEQFRSGSFVKRGESSPGMYEDKQQIEAWIGAELETCGTPNKIRSFEDRGLPPKSRRNKSGSTILNGHLSRSGELCSLPSSRTLSFSEDSANGDLYEGEFSCGNNDTSGRVGAAVRTHKLQDVATPVEEDNRSSCAPPTLQYREEVSSVVSGAACQAAVLSEQESIPPSSILNHSRNRAASNASVYASADASINLVYNCYNESDSSKSLTVSLVRSRSVETPGRSGRSSHDNLNDEVWERVVRDSSSGAKSPPLGSVDGQEKVLNTHHRHLSDLTHHRHLSDLGKDYLGIPPWPGGKFDNVYARTPSADSKDASSSSFSDLSLRSPSNNGSCSPQDKSSPVSVLQPPLPKSPSESWLSKLRPPAPPSEGTNWRGTNQGAKKLEHSVTSVPMDAKWEVIVKSESAHVINKLA